MSTLPPRAVFVTRETDYELLRVRHATRSQAQFFLEAHGQKLHDLEKLHDRFHSTLQRVRATVPGEWRQTLVMRRDLDRFLFTREDIVIAVGQDGLVANVAKYVSGLPVLGINPLPDLYDGVLARITPDMFGNTLRACFHGTAAVESRTMVEASLDNGTRLVALNEIFIGHRSHQSARYRVADGDQAEEQSSSGLIVASGTAATGWAKSIMEMAGAGIPLDPQERAVAYFIREPFASKSTGASMRVGKIGVRPLTVISHMNEGGVIFADGVEQDFLTFDWGLTVTLKASQHALQLVTM